MADPNQMLHDDFRHAVDVLAKVWLEHSRSYPDTDQNEWFDELRRKVVARSTTLQEVANLGPMGGGGPNEA
jgi:hypothetical protein